MSRQSMIETMTGRHPSLAGIGQFTRDSDSVFFEIGWPEFERDTVWARQILGVWTIDKGSVVLVTARNCEGPWFAPVSSGLRESGVVYATAEPYSWDVRRTVTMMKLLPLKAIIGLSDEGAGALLADDEAKELLSKVPVILARQEAVGALREAGIDCAAMEMLGPALAVECPARDGLHVNPQEWRPTQGSAGLELAVVGDRVYDDERISLDIDGQVVEGACSCGLPGARVRLT